MSVVAGIMVPHPPLIIPEVGKGGERQIALTSEMYERAAEFVRDMRPETIVLSSPHSVMYSDYLHISPGRAAKGDMASFGAEEVRMEVDYDEGFSKKLAELADKNDLPAGSDGERNPALDHGTMVPLYFILRKYKDFKLVRLGISGISFEDHYRLGRLVQKAADELGRRVLYVASGDLSHKLKDYGPYGYDKAGPVYDEKIMDVMGSADFGELLNFDKRLCDDAAECGHRSFIIMAGAFDGKRIDARRLSHEDITGVGYGICTFEVTGDDPERVLTKTYRSGKGEAYGYKYDE